MAAVRFVADLRLERRAEAFAAFVMRQQSVTEVVKEIREAIGVVIGDRQKITAADAEAAPPQSPGVADVLELEELEEREFVARISPQGDPVLAVGQQDVGAPVAVGVNPTGAFGVAIRQRRQQPRIIAERAAVVRPQRGRGEKKVEVAVAIIVGPGGKVTAAPQAGRHGAVNKLAALILIEEIARRGTHERIEVAVAVVIRPSNAPGLTAAVGQRKGSHKVVTALRPQPVDQQRSLLGRAVHQEGERNHMVAVPQR